VRRGANDAHGNTQWECIDNHGDVGLVRGSSLKYRICRERRKAKWEAEQNRRLSSRRVQELAEWYSHPAYWHYSPNALAAGALDAELRAILRKEVSPGLLEIELERVLTSSRLSAFPIERGRFPA
jgi:hypothetical protein